MALSLPGWIWRVLLGVAVVIGVLWIATSWWHSNQIRQEFLIPRPALTGFDLTVSNIEAGRVTVTRTAESEREGLWGLGGGEAYAQVSTIVRLTADQVERGVKTLDGEFVVADEARIDPNAFEGDPFEAHRIGWDPIVTPSEIGPHSGWFIDGRRSTWVLFVHGMGNDRLPESLRIIPSLVEQGYPVMVVTYRNDQGATPNESGMRLWGLEEWRDIDAAVQLGERKGAKDFVVIGSGYGASIVSTFLHQSNQIGIVRGVIYDSPVVDLESVVARWADERSTPGPVAWLGRRLATVRFGVEWDLLNQMDRLDEFDVPMLVLIGGEDPVSDPAQLEAFASGVSSDAQQHRFEQGGHADLWNIDQNRYEQTIEQWLLSVIGPE
ncbi:MAG: alpha/beta hydrolase [Acidimicrobiia bacterium]